jgi:PTH1 family peptidyl-tRNA hydrolase
VWLLVGLGNPGSRYSGTRHNFGFHVVDRMARETSASWHRRFASSLMAECELAGVPVLLAKPQTFMNLSGAAVVELAAYRGISQAEVLIYLDDIALPLGALRIRQRGGDGGHLGLASVLEALGAEEVPRVRLGIRPAVEPEDLSEFVLEPFTSEEEPIVEEVVERAVSATRCILSEGMDKAMSIYNAGPSQ